MRRFTCIEGPTSWVTVRETGARERRASSIPEAVTTPRFPYNCGSVRWRNIWPHRTIPASTGIRPVKAYGSGPGDDEIVHDRLLRLDEVERISRRSRSSIYRDINEGNFPQSIKIGARSVAWRLSAIQEWMDSRPHSLDQQ